MKVRAMMVAALAAAAAIVVGCAPEPPPTTTPPSTTAPAWIEPGTCFSSQPAGSPGSYYTLQFVGPENALNNFRAGNAVGGACTPALPVMTGFALVRAATSDAASATCRGIRASGFNPTKIASLPTLPADAWVCWTRRNGPLNITIYVIAATPGVFPYHVGTPLNLTPGVTGTEPEDITSCVVSIDGVVVPAGTTVDAVTGYISCAPLLNYTFATAGDHTLTVTATTASLTLSKSTTINIVA